MPTRFDRSPMLRAAPGAARRCGPRALLASLAAGVCLSTAAAPPPSSIALRESVTVDAAQLRLADMAELAGFDAPLAHSLGRQILWPSPPPCGAARIAKSLVEARLRELRPDALARSSVVGASQISIERTCQHLAGADVAAVGRESLERWLASRSERFEVADTVAPATIDLPAGNVSLTARPRAGNEPVSHRMQVWVDVSLAGRFVRAVPVAFDVHAWRPAWVATRDARVDESLAGAALERRDVDIATQAVMPLADAPADARLRKPLLAGQALSPSHVETIPPVLRGSFVTVRSLLGAIGVEARAEALQDGRPGQLVWVRMATSTGPVHARVVSEGIVEVQHE